MLGRRWIGYVGGVAAIGVALAVGSILTARRHAAPAAKARATASTAHRKVRSIQDRFRPELESATIGDARQDEGRGERDGFDAWFFGQRAYPADQIPAGAVNAAFGSARRHNDDSDEEDFGNTWEALGPSTIPDGQTDATVKGTLLSPVSGRLTAIAVHPWNPNVVYAAGAQGGVWKTRNALSKAPRWAALTDHEASLAIGAIAVDPVNPDIIYAGTGEPNRSCDSYYGQGILRSSDGGEHWVLLGSSGSPFNNPGPFVGKAVAKILIDPLTAGSTHATTIWAATTIGVFTSGTIATCQTPSGPNVGLWRSTDSGQTWQLQNVPQGQAGLFSVQDAAMDPNNSNIVYAAVRSSGVYKSTNATAPAATFAPTPNGFPLGSTSTPIRRINVSIGGSAAPGTLFAAVENNTGSALFGLFKTADAGATWQHVDNGFNGTATFAVVVIAPGPPPTKAVLVTRGSGPAFKTDGTWTGRRLLITATGGSGALHSRTIFKVLDADHLLLTTASLGVPAVASGNYSVGNYPNYCDGQCFYDMTVKIDPSNGNRTFVGGNPEGFKPDLSGVKGAHTLWRTDDGGASWMAISQGNGTGGVHTDDHAVALDVLGNLYDGNDGGLWRSSDLGGSWTSMNTNLAITQFQGVSTHPTNTKVVLGGTQDNGTNLLNRDLAHPPAWFHSDFGDGGQSLIDQSKPATMFHTYFNQSFNFMGPARTDNGGQDGPGSWPFVGAYFGYGADYYNGMDPTDPVSFYAPLAQHPAFAPNVVYFGSNRVYRSPNPLPTLAKKPSWTAVSPVLTKPGPKGAVTAEYVSWIGVLPNLVGGKEVLYSGASDGRIEVSSQVNGGGIAPWTVIDKAPLPNRAVTGIAVDASDATGNTAYVTFSGFNGSTPTQPGHVFKTTNGLGAATWTDITGDLPDIPMNAVILQPVKHGRMNIYVASDIGVFRTSDGGAHWRLLSKGLPFVTVFGLERNATTGEIVASTHGRGMFRLKQEDKDN